MKRTSALIIGGGQAGLAMSRCLTERDIDHVVLERGRVAERWRTERWSSLRLLTPRWQSRLPAYRYRGSDPDGYMAMPEVVAYLVDYARSASAPVLEETTVLSVEPARSGYRVITDGGAWQTPNVIVATGYCDAPHVPPMATSLPPSIHQVVPTRYRSSADLPEGGVLVVGASATGVQLAEEIHASGRPVTLAVGRHVRLPRTYRGKDILWWLDRAGILDERADAVVDLDASRRQASFQLVGRPDRRNLDLGTLQAAGVRLTGRALGIDGERVAFAQDLPLTVNAAAARLDRVLARVDAFIRTSGMDGVAPERQPMEHIVAPPGPPEIDLRRAGIRTVVWATGFRRQYPWLAVPVLDESGELCHRGGVTPAPGLYVLGLPFLRRRKSSFIDGVGEDARELAAHLAARMRRRTDSRPMTTHSRTPMETEHARPGSASDVL